MLTLENGALVIVEQRSADVISELLDAADERYVGLIEAEAYQLMQVSLQDGQWQEIDIVHASPIEYARQVFDDTGVERNALIHIQSGSHEYLVLDLLYRDDLGQLNDSGENYCRVAPAEPDATKQWLLKINAELLMIDKALWREKMQRGIKQGYLGIRKDWPTVFGAENDRCRKRFPYIADTSESANRFIVQYASGRLVVVAGETAGPIVVSWQQLIPATEWQTGITTFDASEWFSADPQATVYLPYAALQELVGQAKAGRFSSVHEVVDFILTSRLAWDDTVRRELMKYGIMYCLPHDEATLFPGQIAVRIPQDPTKWLVVPIK